jgi:hypothetical protein
VGCVIVYASLCDLLMRSRILVVRYILSKKLWFIRKKKLGFYSYVDRCVSLWFHGHRSIAKKQNKRFARPARGSLDRLSDVGLKHANVTTMAAITAKAKPKWANQKNCGPHKYVELRTASLDAPPVSVFHIESLAPSGC